MPTSKCLINDIANTVTESIDGYLLTRPDLVRLDGFPGIKVVAQRNIDRSKVAIISGGGAGHEPAHAGLVAKGLLTAAVSGDVFASPHVLAILTAIRHCTLKTCAGGVGAVLIVKNYTGDRLAFGLAAETARAEGYAVSVVFVADDSAVDGGPITGRRGIAGTLFVHKVAGYLSQSGYSLEKVTSAAQEIAATVVSVGASLSACSVPGASTTIATTSATTPEEKDKEEDTAADGKAATASPLSSTPPPPPRLQDSTTIEIGLGIHGEPGAETVKGSTYLMTSDALAERLLNMLEVERTRRRKQRRSKSEEGKETTSSSTTSVVLINNLGGMSNLEMGIFTKSVVDYLRRRRAITTTSSKGDASSASSSPSICSILLGVAPLMTSLDMKGVSISLLPLDDIMMDHYAGLLSEDTSDISSTTTATSASTSDPLQIAKSTLKTMFTTSTSCPHWPSFVEVPLHSSTMAAADGSGSSTSISSSIVPLPVTSSSSSSSSSSRATDSPSSSSSSSPELGSIPYKTVRTITSHVKQALLKEEGELSRLDALAGDGDAGLTMKRIAEAVATAVDTLGVQEEEEGGENVTFTAVFGRIAESVAANAGGSSGVLYALMLRAAQKAASDYCSEEVSTTATSSTSTSHHNHHHHRRQMLSKCLDAAVSNIIKYGGANEGDRTMLDALIPASKALHSNSIGGNNNSDIGSVSSLSEAVAAAAEAGADTTTQLPPRAGRASYVSTEICKGHRDAGAHAVAVWMRAIADVLA